MIRQVFQRDGWLLGDEQGAATYSKHICVGEITAILSAYEVEGGNVVFTAGQLMAWGLADYENALIISDDGEILNQSYVGGISSVASKALFEPIKSVYTTLF